MNEFKHTPDMGEISGFGDSYEAACQQMLHNGVAFLQAKAGEQGIDVKVLELENVYGIVKLEGEDAEALEAAVMGGIEDATGAMHHAVMSRLAWINKNGWDKYCEELRKPPSVEDRP